MTQETNILTGNKEVTIYKQDDWRNTNWSQVCVYLGVDVNPKRLAYLAQVLNEEFVLHLRGHAIAVTFQRETDDRRGPIGSVRITATRPVRTHAEAVQNAEAAARGDESL